MGTTEQMIPSTSAVAITQNEQTRVALQMRKAGMTLFEIGEQLGVSYETVRRRIRTAMALNIRDLVEEVRSQELEALDRLEKVAEDLIDTRYLKVSAGRLVMIGLKDVNGDPIIDARTGLPAEVPMLDKEPVKAAIETRLKIMDRKAKLLGMDLEKQAPAPQEDPMGGAGALSAQQMEAAMTRWLAQMDGRKRARAAETLDATVVSTQLSDDPIMRQE